MYTYTYKTNKSSKTDYRQMGAESIITTVTTGQNVIMGGGGGGEGVSHHDNLYIGHSGHTSLGA